MSELEKKYSHYQESECKEEQIIEAVSEKLCPTCEEDPNFKLRAQWFEIPEAYLNRKFCEYHVRVYESEAKIENSTATGDELQGVIFEIAALKILRDFDKPINVSTKDQVIKAASIVDNYLQAGSGDLGAAYLVAVPAFNFDTIPTNKEDDTDQRNDDQDFSNGGEFILQVDGLNKKLRFLEFTLGTYGQFYAMVQLSDDGFVIRQEEDLVQRINYNNTKQKLKIFRKKLNDALANSGYPKIWDPGLFHPERVERIKFIFKSDGLPFELKNVWILPDNGCEKYEELIIPENNPLRDPSNAVIYNFLQNLDEVYNDIIAADTMPWLDWTLKHFYPTYIVDRGSIEDLGATRSGLECLLEESLGGFGTDTKVVDYLAREIMSAFSSFEQEFNEQACREVERLKEGSVNNDSPSKKRSDQAAVQERKLKMVSRYRNEFMNKFYNGHTDDINGNFAGAIIQVQQKISPPKSIRKSDVFSELQKLPVPENEKYIYYLLPTYKFKKNAKTIKFNEGSGTYIYNLQMLEDQASLFAETKFNNLEGEGLSAFFTGGVLTNSPHYEQFLESKNELWNDDTTFLGLIKGSFSGQGDLEPLDVIPVIGLCGINKMAGKALSCLTNGITFDTFLNILIDKLFDYMKVNTLDNFLNNLPYDFRLKLDQALEREFGANVKLTDLLGIKMASGGNESLKDFVRSKQHARRLKELFEKSIGGSNLTSQEMDYLISQIGENIDVWEEIGGEIKTYYNLETKTYSEDPIVKTKFSTLGATKEYKPEDWIIALIKNKRKKYLTVSQMWSDATTRFNTAIGRRGGTGVASQIDQLKYDKKQQNKQLKQEKKSLENWKETTPLSPYSESYETIENFYLDRINKIEEDIKEKNASINQLKEGRQSFEEAVTSIDPSLEGQGDNLIIMPDELNKFEAAEKAFQRTSMGVKVDIIFDLVFDELITFIMEEIGIDELFNELKKYPAADFVLQNFDAFLSSGCPNTPVIYPPPEDFLQSLKVDVCDPTFSLTLPRLNLPSIDWRWQIQKQFVEIFKQAIIKLATDLILKLVERLLTTLEGALCNTIEAFGGLLAGAIRDGNFNEFERRLIDAFDEAFCNDGEDPETSRKRAEELADALFAPLMMQQGMDPTGAGAKIGKIIGTVSTTNEILDAMVGSEGEENYQFNARVANAISLLAPEMRVLLGSPNQVAYFFKNLGSYLSPDDRARIRNLLDADIPNIPISSAICLTDDELDDWNNFRRELLQDPRFGPGLTPEQAADRIADYNKKTEEAVAELMDDIANLADPSGGGSGPLTDALINELGKDPCNPNNVINPSAADPVTAAVQAQLTESFFNNISAMLMRGMTGRNSVLGEAMADFEGRKEFSRLFYKIFNPNYGNSQGERDIKYDSKGRVGQFVMDVLVDKEADPENTVRGAYPATVAIIQREKILDDSGKTYNFSEEQKNVTFRFLDSNEGSFFFPDTSFTQDVSAINNLSNKKSFNYLLQLTEKVNNQPESLELNLNVPVNVADDENEFMESIGFEYVQNDGNNIRKDLFNAIVKREVPITKNYSDLYETAFEQFNKYLVELLMTDPRQALANGLPKPVDIPVGYTFGYVSDDLTEDSFKYYNDDTLTTEYNLEESEKTLGTFGSPRVVALDPALYGGRYTNPPFYIEPRQFSGWMEIATKAFDSPSGCDPKAPPLISFGDIKTRVQDLGNSLTEDPRLSQSQECISTSPFNLLTDKKTKANIDGVVRTTIRAYIAEYFMKGYGLFSNLELNSENYDQGLFLYLVDKMKYEMYELGSSFSIQSRVTIVQEKYWFTFLEQCTEAYKRMVDLGEITPPDNVREALNRIQSGQDLYKPIDYNMKKRMYDILNNDPVVRKPEQNYDALDVIEGMSMAKFCLQATAFRLTTDAEEKRNFFNGQGFSRLDKGDIRYATLRKLRFHQKIYFIALFEREATIVMSELIRNELNRLISIVTDGISDKPYYRSLTMSLFSSMPGSSIRVGLNDYYIDKQISGQANTGQVPDLVLNNSLPPIEATDKAQFIVESYARLEDREDPSLPSIIRNRPQKYVGAIPLSSLEEFVDSNLSTFMDNNLSDFFGNLSFTYRGSFKELMEKGFTDEISLIKLFELNKKDGINIAQLRNSRAKFVGSREFSDFNVIYDESFLTDGENPEPFGTIGSTGVKYGLRVSLVFPKDYFSQQEISELRSDVNFMNKSIRERSYLFDDNTFVMPLASQEIDVVDSKFLEFNPFSGIERYDLECLMKKLVKSPQFKVVFEKLFNVKQCSSLLSIYCMETLLPSIGRKVDEDETGDSQQFERAAGKESDPEDDWDGTINKFAKNFLRREFKSLYLSRTVDGLNTRDDDDDTPFGIGGLGLGNLFDFSMPAIRLPWWQRRRLKKKIYDANDMECADPKKDLQ